MINDAKRSCIALNLSCKSFVKTTCKHGVVVICQSDSHSPGSTAAFFFSTALCLGFGSSFDPHWHERLDSLIRKHLLAAWLLVMALHEANQASSFSLSAMTLRTQAASVCDNTCSVSTQQHRRSEHIVISQGNAVMFCQRIVLFRAKGNNCITHAAAAPSNLDLQRLSCKTQKELLATASAIAAPKPGSWRQSEEKTILKHFLKGLLKRKLQAPKMRKSADKSLSQPWCSHSNTQCQVSQFYLSVTRKYCFPTSFDNTYCT